MVDDGQWHDVIIIRERKDVKLVVDRLESVFETNGLFFKLDLDKKVGIVGNVTYSDRSPSTKR